MPEWVKIVGVVALLSVIGWDAGTRAAAYFGALQVREGTVSKECAPSHLQEAARSETDEYIAVYTCQLAIYTKNVANYTLGLGVVTSILIAVGLWQGVQLKRSVVHGEMAARAANEAAGTAARQLEMAYRPWIPPRVLVASDLVFAAGSMRISVAAVTKNIGGSPAFNVEVRCELWLQPLSQDKTSVQRQATLANNLRAEIQGRRTTGGPAGAPLFPSEMSSTPFAFNVNAEDLNAAVAQDPRGFVLPVIYGAVIYESIAGSIYQTGFVYLLSNIRTTQQPGGIPIGQFPIRPCEGDVPMAGLTLTNLPAGGGPTT